MMKLGIFGGTFDPPHLGHLILAAEAHAQLELDQVLWVLTPRSPLKRQAQITPVETRLALLEAAVAEDPAFRISLVEVNRHPPYYATDTVRLLSKEYPLAELIYLMGGDSLYDLPTWCSPQELLEICSGVGVLRRPGTQIDLAALEVSLPGITQKVQFVDAPRLEISATRIRHLVANGGPWRYYVPPKVFQLIEDLNLYR